MILELKRIGQVSFIITLYTYLCIIFLRGISCSALAEGDEENNKSSKDTNETKEELNDQTPGSNASTLSASSQITEKDSPNCSFSNEEQHSTSEYEIVRSVMYSTRENINIVHEIFRQVFLHFFYYILIEFK